MISRNKSNHSHTLSGVGYACVGVFMMGGSVMQAYTNETVHPVLLAFLLLFTGVSVVSLLCLGSRPEIRAFLLTFSLCLFLGGLAQWYSTAFFGNVQSTVDAPKFLLQISPRPPFKTMADIPPGFNSPLAILIWQQIYKVTWWMGFDFGSYTAVMFNALVMGMTGSITVRTARELFGDDIWRLRRVGTLFAACGLFLLFGAVLLRDCFTTFFNALTLWGLVHWLCRPTMRNLFIALAVTCISAYAIAYLRFESIVLFPFYCCIAILLWFFAGRLHLAHAIVSLIVILALMLGSSYLMKHIQISRKLQAEAQTSYAGNPRAASQPESLGMRLVVRQPMPIRMVLGSGYLMVFPIPLWGYLRVGALDYHLFKAYHGVYQVLVLPLVFAGFMVIFREYLKEGRKQIIPFLFLLSYLLMNLEAVVATSLEQRHLAQFMSAFVILAAIPDTREINDRTIVQGTAITWFALVILVHLAWSMAK